MGATPRVAGLVVEAEAEVEEEALEEEAEATPMEEEEEGIRKCFICKSPDHIKKDCPMKGSATHAYVASDVVLTAMETEASEEECWSYEEDDSFFDNFEFHGPEDSEDESTPSWVLDLGEDPLMVDSLQFTLEDDCTMVEEKAILIEDSDPEDSEEGTMSEMSDSEEIDHHEKAGTISYQGYKEKYEFESKSEAELKRSTEEDTVSKYLLNGTQASKYLSNGLITETGKPGELKILKTGKQGNPKIQEIPPFNMFETEENVLKI
jgi:hypothetical protein